MLSGIDKISITTQEFSVEHKDLLLTKSTDGQGHQPIYLYTDKAGNEVWGNNSFHNTDRLSMTIGGFGMKVELNPSKLYHPFELLTDIDKLREVKAVIEEDLKEVGVTGDIGGAKVWRLDLAKQATMQQPVMMYAEAFRTVKAKRLTGNTYPSGFTFQNKSTQICFYDKGLEGKILGARNFMRGETRFTKTETVQKQTGIITFSDLMKSDAEHLTTCYNKSLQDRLFKVSKNLDKAVKDFSQEEEFIRHLQEKHPKGWFNYWLLMEGLEQKIISLGGLEGVRQLLMQVEHRNNAGRHINKLNELLHMKGVYDASKGTLTVAGMVNEVQTMFAA